MIDPFSIIGIIVVIVLALSLGRIFSYLFKFLYYTLITALVLVFIFGISWNELVSMVQQLLLLVF